MSLQLRPLNVAIPGELRAVLDLFSEVFGRSMSESFYRWRFLQNPFGPTLVMLLWDGPRLAGHYAASSMRGWYRGDFASAQSMTTMTHPDYRNRDVFTQLASGLYRRMATDFGIRMIWGFPNTKSHFGLVQRLGWRDVALLPTLTRDLAGLDGAEGGLVSSSAMPSGIDELFARSDDGRALLSARDERYMRWRYAENPDTRYSWFAVGDSLAVTKTYEIAPDVRSLEIVDYLYAKNPRALGDLVGGLLRWAKVQGYGYVRTWASLSDPLYPLLEKLTFVPREPLTYFCVRPISGSLTPELEQARTWCVTMGDSDNY